MLLLEFVKKEIFIGLLLVSCSQAGTIPSDGTPSVTSSPNTTLQIAGQVGIGEPLIAASITVVDVSNPESPAILSTTESDQNGAFQLDLDALDSDSQILIVASGGSYTDPITFQSVSGNTLRLEGSWKFRHLATLEHLDVTPLTTLATSFYRCLLSNATLTADPLDYSIATFQSLFGVNLNSDHDVFLDGSADDPTLYSLYNLAFARMAKEKHAVSAMAILTAYSEYLEDECDLLGPSAQYSGSYAFHRESFRRDYLNALENLRLEAAFSSWIDNFDLESQVDAIRSRANILFQFEDYSL